MNAYLDLKDHCLCRDYLSPYDIMVNYPYMVVLGTGLAFGFLVVRYVLPVLLHNPLKSGIVPHK